MTNPIMKIEERQAEQERVLDSNDIMTINGTLQITGFMGLILVFAKICCWTH